MPSQPELPAEAAASQPLPGSRPLPPLPIGPKAPLLPAAPAEAEAAPEPAEAAPSSPVTPFLSSSSSSANTPPYKIVKVSANSKNYVTIIGDPNLSEEDLLESIYKLPAIKPQPVSEKPGKYPPEVQVENAGIYEDISSVLAKKPDMQPKSNGGRRRTMNHSKGVKRSKNRSTKRSKGRKQRK